MKNRPLCDWLDNSTSTGKFLLVSLKLCTIGTWHSICRRQTQKWWRFTHLQDNTFYAVILFLHHGYDYSTRFLSLAKKLVWTNYIIIYTYVYSNSSYKTKVFPKPPFNDHDVSFAGWTASEKLPAGGNFEKLGIDWHFTALCSLSLYKCDVF